MNIQTINPATEEVVANYSLLTKEKITQGIELGHTAYWGWRKTSFDHRKQCMLKMASLLKKEKNKFAILMATEMGKPIRAGITEIEKCAWVCEYYAEQAENYLSPKIIQTQMKKTMVCYQPLGVIFAIMPWNFPFWQVFRAVVPTLMAGNAVILKHAPISFGSGNVIAQLFLEAGFPEYLVQHCIMDTDQAADVIAHPSIKAITLTGSDRAGSAVAAQAGKYLKKVSLELGGNDPYLILDDAPIAWTAKLVVAARLANCGQVCIAPKRIIVLASIHDQFIKEIELQMAAYQMSDPLDISTNLGPMARKDLRETLNQQVLKSIEAGAQLVCGGEIPKRKGFYYPPTLLLNVHRGMPAFDEELFGPVISVIKASDEKEAIQLANESQYGLGAAVFTSDLKRGEQLAREEIEAGSCFVNAIVTSDPRVPFGGIKNSGFGRELSQEGMLEFVNIKTVSLNDINT